MKIAAYLSFDGRCAEAFAFYAKALGGTIPFIQTFGESPMAEQMAPEWRDKVMHATLTVGDQTLYGADPPPVHYAKPQGVSMSITPASPAEGERIFSALAEGGSVTMPFGKQFWSEGFGMLTDRYGIAWMVNCETVAA
jgi:PhnB protein